MKYVPFDVLSSVAQVEVTGDKPSAVPLRTCNNIIWYAELILGLRETALRWQDASLELSMV